MAEILASKLREHYLSNKNRNFIAHREKLQKFGTTNALPKTIYLLPIEKFMNTHPPVYNELPLPLIELLGTVSNEFEQSHSLLVDYAEQCSVDLVATMDKNLEQFVEDIHATMLDARDCLRSILHPLLHDCLTNKSEGQRLEQSASYYRSALQDVDGVKGAVELLKRTSLMIRKNVESMTKKGVQLCTNEKDLIAKGKPYLALVWNLTSLSKRIQAAIERSFDSGNNSQRTAVDGGAKPKPAKRAVRSRTAGAKAGQSRETTEDPDGHVEALIREFLELFELNKNNRDISFISFIINNDEISDDEKQPLTAVYLLEASGRKWNWKKTHLPKFVDSSTIDSTEQTPSTISLVWQLPITDADVESPEDMLIEQFTIYTKEFRGSQQEIKKGKTKQKSTHLANPTNIEELIATVETEGSEMEWRVELLDDDKGYCFAIKPICMYGLEVKISEFSAPFYTKKEYRRALRIKDRAEEIADFTTSKKLSTYLLARDQVLENKGVRKFVIGSRNTAAYGDKVMLVVGGTGSGKTMLINSLCNFLYEVEREDKFRFKVISPHEDQQDGDKTSGKGKSKTKTVTAYEFNDTRLHYRLTVVDTPGFGDTEGIDQDAITRGYIKEWFEELGKSTDGINQLDAICIVIKSSETRITPQVKYELREAISLFSKNMEKNVLVLYTFCDSDTPPAEQALAELQLPKNNTHKFNNSAFFGEDTSGKGIHQFYWDMGMKSFDNFFKDLDKLKPQSITLSKQVLDERERLEQQAIKLSERVKEEIDQVNTITNLIHTIRDNRAEIIRNKDFVVKKQIHKNRKKEIAGQGLHTTTCIKCNYTCHNNCVYANNDDKYMCVAMDKTTIEEAKCTVCPQKCSWRDHHNLPYLIEWYIEEEEEKITDMMDRYNIAVGEADRVQALIIELAEQLLIKEMVIANIVKDIRSRLNELDKISMRPGLMTDSQYIEALIVSERSQLRTGFEKRIAILERHQQTMQLLEKSKDGEHLLEDKVEQQTFDFLFKECPEFAKQFASTTYHQIKHSNNPGILGKLVGYVASKLASSSTSN